MKRQLSAVLIFVVMTLCAVPVCADEVDTSAHAYVLCCADSGGVLLSENPDERLAPASTTKIMTVLLTLEEAARDDRVITFTEDMTAEGSSMYLRIGEQVRLSDLAAGMMMQSGNDAANAAAIAIAGSLDDFAALMNRKAAELGMENTHFMTPSGLDDDEHYSTARDLAKLTAYAMQNDDFRRLTSKSSVTVTFVMPEGKHVTYPNHNRLLNLYDDCIGGKTGYTQKAGRCLVSAAERDGLMLIAVTLDDRDDWNDHIALYEYGFDHYTAYSDDSIYRADIVGGTVDKVAVRADTAGIAVSRDRIGDIRTKVDLPPFIYAPVYKNDDVGRVILTLDGKRIGQYALLADEDIPYDSRRRGFFEYLTDVLRL